MNYPAETFLRTAGKLEELADNTANLARAQHNFDHAIAQEIERIWQEIAELRDELHALAVNRPNSNTQG